jgi:3-isopropylmalate/(R)-2-methylmalate dehydratase small subunit
MTAIEDDPSIEIVVDVVDRRVAVPAIDIDEPFHLDDFHHQRLVKGLDDIALTLQHDAEIASYESTRAPWLPSTR